MKGRRLQILWAFAGMLLLAIPGFAQQITTVGVIDTARVYSTYFTQSTAVRELESFRDQFQNELNRHSQELRDLQEQKLNATNAGNDALALGLDQEILQKAQFIRDFQRIRQRQLDDMQNNLTQSDAFFRQMQEAIRLVSEAEGFTVVLDARDSALLWWSSEVDITDAVIARLRTR